MGENIVLHWVLLMRCKDCGAEYESTNPASSLEPMLAEDGKMHRMVLIGVPESCPECHNVRAVPAAGE